MKDKEKQIKKSKQTSYHDEFFKDCFSHLDFALELFQILFSKEELTAYDLSKLKIEKDTLKDKRADLIFSVPLKSAEVDLKIFILLEHKSSYDKRLFNQLLGYQTSLYTKPIERGFRPGPVLPIVFYHGKTPWKWKLSFQEAIFGTFL